MKISLMPLKKISDSKLIPLFPWPNCPLKFKTKDQWFWDPPKGREVVSKMSKKEEAVEVSDKHSSGFTYISSSSIKSLAVSWAVNDMEKS